MIKLGQFLLIDVIRGTYLDIFIDFIDVNHTIEGIKSMRPFRHTPSDGWDLRNDRWKCANGEISSMKIFMQLTDSGSSKLLER